MYNIDVCNYIKKMKIDRPAGQIKYIADEFVKDGYGQTCGGYLDINGKGKTNPATISQEDHFLSYYNCDGRSKGNPSYQYLRCPQLLLYIAEIAGVAEKSLISACKTIKNYEDENELKYTSKNGNYLWGKKEFREFKTQLYISSITKIIKSENDWSVVLEQVEKMKRRTSAIR